MPRGQYKRRTKKNTTEVPTTQLATVAHMAKTQGEMLAEALTTPPSEQSEFRVFITPGAHNLTIVVGEPLTVLTPTEALKLSARLNAIAMEAIRRG